jgi:hypothetical protein
MVAILRRSDLPVKRPQPACATCGPVREDEKQELSFLAWVLWAIVAGLLLAPFVIAAAGGAVPAPAFLHGHGPF